MGHHRSITVSEFKENKEQIQTEDGLGLCGGPSIVGGMS